MSVTGFMNINGFNELSAVWGSHMGTACWRGGLALLVALLLVRLVRSLPAAARCGLCRLAFLNLLIVGLWFFTVPLRLLPPLQTTPAPALGRVIDTPAATRQQPGAIPEVPGAATAQADSQAIQGNAQEVGTRASLHVTSLAFIAWWIGVSLFSFRLLWQWSRVRMFLRGTSLVVDSALQSRLVATCRRMNVRFPPELRVSSVVGSPCLVGVFRPVIVLPTQVFESCSREALDAALLHELAHVRRRDLLWNWLPAVAEVVFFFHPLVWLARRDWRLSQEIAADELAISASHVDVVDYAGRLLELVSICRSTTLPSHLAVAVSETFTQLSLRITAMHSFESLTATRRFFAAGLLTVAALGIVPWNVTHRDGVAQAMGTESSSAGNVKSPKPAQPENERLATPAEAILAVEKLGGDVVLDTNAPDTRVISVSLFKTKATDSDLRGLKALTTLRALTLVATPVTDAGLEQISGLTNLGLLELNETAISDAGLAHLRGLTRMGELGLSRTKITNRGLAHLKEMKDLVMLLLEGTKITDEGMTHLSEFTRLKTLTLSSTAVTDTGLETLRTLTELHDLRLNYTEVGDAGLAHLAGATELRTLLLHKTKVTDASVQRLSEFKHLRFLDVDKTALTEAGVKQLRTKLPACQIVWNVPNQDLPALLKEFELVEHFWQQEEVGRKLIATGDPRVIPAMKRLLGVPSRRRRCNAGWVLDAMGDPAGLPSVLRDFEDTADRAVEPGGRPSKNGVPDVGLQIADDRYYAALVLGRIGKREAVPALIAGLKDETVNLQSAISLAQIGDRQAIPALRQMAIDSPTKRLWASYGLAALGEQEGFDFLFEVAANEPSWTDRRHAVEALGTIGDRRATSTVIDVLRDEQINVRVSAAITLGKIGDPAALPALTAALSDTEETTINAPTTVAHHAREAIDAIHKRQRTDGGTPDGRK